jgi:hypothetical protein
VKSPSPIIHQQLDFCLQRARDLPFRELVVPGSSPLYLKQSVLNKAKREEKDEGQPKLDTNLIEGRYLRGEFLEPLSDKVPRWLHSNMQKPHFGAFRTTFNHLVSKLRANFNL